MEQNFRSSSALFLGGAITNFADKLPSPQSELAQTITKDTYDFGFISLEDGYKEEALETELEKQLIIAGKTRKLDMLFFHINLNCYIVVELKAVPFQPEFVTSSRPRPKIRQSVF